MSKHEIKMYLPLDKDGFLRRECPNCKRQFKWFPSKSETGQVAQTQYYCPYCEKVAPINSWWTKKQLEYTKQFAVNEIVDPELRKFVEDIRRLNRPGSPVSFNASYKGSSEPLPLQEPNDMRRVEPPCHPSEPLKVYEDWKEPVACLICGKSFLP